MHEIIQQSDLEWNWRKTGKSVGPYWKEIVVIL